MVRIPRSTGSMLVIGAVLLPFAPAKAQSETIKMGALIADTFGEAYYGVDMGFFRGAGLNAQVETFTNGSTIMQAVASGGMDVGISNIVQIASGIARGLPFQVIAPAALYTTAHPYTKLCLAKTSLLANAKDLNGKTIAVSTLNDFNQLGAQAWLKQNGADPASVRFVELAFAEMGPALQRGIVDAAVITEPSLTVALRSGAVRPFADIYSVIAPEFANIAWFTTRGWATKNPELLKRLTSAIFTTARWANSHQPQSGAILAKYGKIDPSLVSSMSRAVYATSNDPKLFQAPLDFSVRYGLLKRAVSVSELTGQ